MAVDNKSETQWSEENVSALYRAWQKTRDGVDYQHYRSILSAAKEQTRLSRAAAETERRMEQIRAQAIAMYPAPAAVSERQTVADSVHPLDLASQFSKAIDALKRRARDIADSMNMGRLVPVAAAIALVAAVTPFFLGNTPSFEDSVSAQVASLDLYQSQVPGEINRLGEYQHGFTDSGSSTALYSEAFVSGVTIVDLQTLDAVENSDTLERLVNSMKTSRALEGSAVDTTSLSLQQQVILTSEAIERHYDDSGYKTVFLFGQWIESSYLLSRVAQENNDHSVMSAALGNLPQLREILDAGGFMNARLEQDFGKLEAIRQNASADRDAVSAASAILLKLRTVEALKKG